MFIKVPLFQETSRPEKFLVVPFQRDWKLVKKFAVINMVLWKREISKKVIGALRNF